jgi:hypothetical protein
VRNESRFNGLSLRLCTSDLVVDFQCPDSFAIAAKMKIKRDFLIASRYTFVALRPLEVTDIFKALSVGGAYLFIFSKALPHHRHRTHFFDAAGRITGTVSVP